MGADQHALEKAMRIALEIPAVLEGAGLALVAIDRHQPRPGLAEHRAPFSSRRKTGAAKPAQRGVVERLQQVFFGELAGANPLEQFVAAAGDVGFVTDIIRQMGVGVAVLHSREHALDTGMVDEMVADLRRRRGIATADAGRPHHANAGARLILQLVQQFFAAQHRAGQGIADPDGQRRDIGLALLHDVEMRIEGRGLEHFRKGQLHLVGERGEMGRGNLVIAGLDQMQMFDQEIAAPRPVAEQKLDFVRGGRLDLTPLRRRAGPLASLARMLERANLLNIMSHWKNLAFRQSCRLSPGMPDAKTNQASSCQH